MDKLSDLLLPLALGGLAVSGLLFASALLYPYLRSAWDKATALARAVFCGAVVAACLFGGAKHTGSITYPKTDTDVAYLTDAGSYVTNDAVHVAFTRVIVPDTASFYLDYCALDETNAQGVATNWVNAKTATFGELEVPFDFAFANATNYNWMAYTDWTPGPAVQTNGVWHAYWGLDSKQGRYFIPVRTCVRDGGEVIATPRSKLYAKDPLLLTEAEAYERYAPDTAFVIDLSLTGTNTFTIPSVGGTHYIQGIEVTDMTVDWGDGSTDTVTTSGWGGQTLTHEYAAAGVYVIRFSDCPTRYAWKGGDQQNSAFGDVQRHAVVRALRWGDHSPMKDRFGWAGATFGCCDNLTAFPDGKLPRWPKDVKPYWIPDTYANCTSLAATSFPEWPANCTSIGGVYQNCTGIKATSLPAWPTSLQQANYTFCNCSALAATSFPDWPTTLTQANYTFWNCTSLAATSLPDWSNCTNLTSIEGVYGLCSKISAEIIPWPPNVKIVTNAYRLCPGIYGAVPEWPDTVTHAHDTFWNTKVSGNIPKWGEAMVVCTYTYEGCQYLTGAWTDDPAELMPTNITSHGSCVSGASAALRALFYSDWGGTRTKTE